MSRYTDSLEAAWADHLASRESAAPTVVSLFAGCGGSSLGYSMAGFSERLAVEWDKNAAETFRVNFPEVPLFHRDIAKLTDAEALARAGLAPGQLDVLDGSPPCQGFSTAGKRDMADPRNALFVEYCRLLRAFRPRALVMENVSGLVKGKMRLAFVTILREPKGCGYRVSARLLNAMYFGVPQSRQRLIFIGVREDLPAQPSHPRAQANPYTMRDAIGDLSNLPVAVITASNERHFRAGRCPARSMDSPSPTLTKSGLTALTCSGDDPAKNKKLARALEVNQPGAPAGTLSKRCNTAGLHYGGERYLATQEYSRLASFPDAFRWIGGPHDVFARIGNSVPPLFMRAIALHLRGILRAADGEAEAPRDRG